eukprot:INCI15500.2.p1 GENE.INCI15500.2~~INCI15500.2.p1  ORF type:complete len:487 (-),score=74.85 INCI15500.2:42-1502(-)
MDAATTADQSPPRRRPRLLADTESSPTTAAVETTGEEDAPDRCGENAKGGNAVEASAKQSKATTMLNIALETDIGHDCDDIQALIVALKDHLIGRVRIVYIATVSQANVRRANLVQWLCGRMGVHDVPIVPSLREKAKVEGRPLNNCVDLWQYVLNEDGTEYQKHPSVSLEDTLPPPRHRSPISDPTLSVVTKQRLLREAGSPSSVIIIGPGAEPQTFEGLDPKLIRSVVWQGNKLDRDSFNVKCDMSSAVAITAWCAKHHVPSYHIGKLTARATRLTRAQFLHLLRAIPQGASVDFRMLLQLGVMEFRDAARNMFNCINFGVSSPGQSAVGPFGKTFDPSNADHAALKDILEMPSTKVAWFDKMKTLTPLYDVTAYLLCRDTVPGSTDSPWYNVSTGASCPSVDSTPQQRSTPTASSSPDDARGDSNDGKERPRAYGVTAALQLPSCFFAVGELGSDIRDPATYMPKIVEELRQGLALMRAVPTS